MINSCQDFGRFSCFHLQGGPKNYSKFMVARSSEMSVAIYQCTTIYRVIQEESALLWEMIV